MTVEDMEDAVEDGFLPAAAVHAVEDHEGRVLYDKVTFGKYEVTGDMECEGQTPGTVAAAVAVFGCSMAYAGS